MINFFSKQFEMLNNIDIAESINKNSFFSFENAVNNEILDKILNEIDLFNLF